MAEKSTKTTLAMRYIVVLITLFLTSCTDLDKHEINTLLDDRNASISTKNIERYQSILSQAYLSNEGANLVQSMSIIFDRFDEIEMLSRDRVIQIIDENHAICEQTFMLKVLANGEWRKIIKREQLKFELEGKKWKISSGL